MHPKRQFLPPGKLSMGKCCEYCEIYLAVPGTYINRYGLTFHQYIQYKKGKSCKKKLETLQPVWDKKIIISFFWRISQGPEP